MSRTMTATKSPSDWGFVHTGHRRDFLKLTSTGLLVLFGRSALGGARSRPGSADGPPGLPHRLQRLPPHRRRRPRDLLRRQGRDGAGRDDLARRSCSPRSWTSPLASVDIVMGDTDLCPWDMGTFGSLSIRSVRAGPARGRRRGAGGAAGRWPPSGSRCRSTALDGEGRRGRRRRPTRRRRSPTASSPKASGSSASSTASRRSKPVTAFTIVGTSAPRRDAIEKVTGQGEVRRRHRAGRRAARADPAPAGARRRARPGRHVGGRGGAGRPRRPRRRPHRRAARASRRGRQGARAREGARSRASTRRSTTRRSSTTS